MRQVIMRPRIGSGLGTYLTDINQTPLLDAEEEKVLGRLIHGGDGAARDRMIRANLRLVVRIARDFRGRGASMEDLVEEGNLGLIRAVEWFDPTMNTRFSTYAAYWIKQSMTHCVRAARTLTLPAYVMQLLREWKRESGRLETELNRLPTDEEINAHLHLSPRRVRIIMKAINVLTSKPNGTNESQPNIDEILPFSSNGHENRVATTELLGKALQLLDELDDREAKILRLRFGLKGAEPMSLEQVGKRLGLTRESVRQIEIRALLKLHEWLDPPSRHDE
jgi:RNA polymerase primary sigma factor